MVAPPRRVRLRCGSEAARGSRRARRRGGGGRRGAWSRRCRSRSARATARRGPAPASSASARARRAAPRRRRPGVIADLARGRRARSCAGLMCGALGERRHREVGVEVIGDPGLELAQRRGGRRAARRAGALNWAWPPGRRAKSDERAGDRRSATSRPEVLLDQREREVHPRGDAGRGADVAVADEDRVGLDLDRGVAARERVARGPVGGGPPAVEQSGRGEQEGAGADRRRRGGRRPARRADARRRAPRRGRGPRCRGRRRRSGVEAPSDRRDRGGWGRIGRPLAPVDRRRPSGVSRSGPAGEPAIAPAVAEPPRGR